MSRIDEARVLLGQEDGAVEQRCHGEHQSDLCPGTLIPIRIATPLVVAMASARTTRSGRIAMRCAAAAPNPIAVAASSEAPPADASVAARVVRMAHGRAPVAALSAAGNKLPGCS